MLNYRKINYLKLFYFQIMMPLEVEALETIVKDGIKKIMSHVAGRRQEKKRSWFIAVKLAAIAEYQRKLKDEFLPVLVKDFGSSVTVKFNGGKISEEDIEKIKKFMEMVKKSDIKMILNELVKKVEDLKVVGESNELKDRLNEIKSVLEDGHIWIHKRIEMYVRSVVNETLYKKTTVRTKIEAMFYNFADGDVPDEVKKLLENGMNSVPNTKLTKQQVDKRVGDALLEYVMRFGKRRIYGNAVLQASNVQEWITKVKIFNMDQDSKKFVEDLEVYYPALQGDKI